jgi:predicted porin
VVPFGLSAVRLSYIHANASGGGTDANDATQLALGYTYTLSKRTSVYATLARINNKGAAKFAVNPSADLPAAAVGKKSTGYEAGVRHSF